MKTESQGVVIIQIQLGKRKRSIGETNVIGGLQRKGGFQTTGKDM